jgi:HTH-type transcriptional regulator/antitoxin HigA
MSTELKPIRSAADYERAVARLGELWGAAVGTPEGDQLDVLATLIDAYESEHFPIDPPDPIEAIRFRMEQQGLTRKDLMPMIGTRTRVAEVLNRRRSLSIGMIRRLHEGLGIAAEILIRPSRQTSARGPKTPAAGRTGAARPRVKASVAKRSTSQVPEGARHQPASERATRRGRRSPADLIAEEGPGGPLASGREDRDSKKARHGRAISTRPPVSLKVAILVPRR